ncbi:MAG: formate acetyltransferase [Hungatella hathewayi]|nr:formate acetyltransferase [Hungatella hathewayi]
MLTYEDRIAKIRETKIRHTIEKKKQNGYMDADDYGTVPLPAGYHFSPIHSEGKDYFYGALGNAVNFRAFLENHPLYIDCMEILAGRWADMLPLYRNSFENFEKEFPYEHLKAGQKFYNITPGIGNDAHFACDYDIGMKLGFSGLLEKVRYYSQLHTGKEEFYQAEEITVLAILDFIRRHIRLAKELLEKEERPEISESLREMIKANENLLVYPPQTFLEACQFIAWFNTVSRMYDRDGAGMNLDNILLPFYEEDRKKGRITKEKACFILANLLVNDTHYYQISGVDKGGNDLTNELSYLVLDAAHMLNISVNLTVRVHEHTPDELMKKAVYYLFKDRNGWPRFSGNKGIMNYTRNKGVEIADAFNRIAVGCNWMAVPGLEYPLNDCTKINAVRAFEAAFYDMELVEKKSTELLYQIYLNHMKKTVDITGQGINHHLDHQHEMMPELVMNLMMQNTIEYGEDISVCAKYFTMAVDAVGLATIADSFAALEQRIELEKILTWEEAYEAVKNNFQTKRGERIRLMLKSSERYCQGNSLGDKWAARISKDYTEVVKSYQMPKHRQLVPGWFSWSNTIDFGKAVGATPDGRFAHTPITHGANPNPGFRKDGAATSMATGIARIQSGYGNTCPLQLEMDPKISADDGGLENVEKLLKTHIDMGGTLININILDKDVLFKAHENPMLFPDLVVRVTGFTAYFATLSPEFRQLVVDRFVEGF